MADKSDTAKSWSSNIILGRKDFQINYFYIN